jgi:hypothetical protein
MHPPGVSALRTPLMVSVVPRRSKVFVGNLKHALDAL